MNKNILLTITLFIPSVVLAHDPGGMAKIWFVMFFSSLIISLILLSKIRRYITIKNKIGRFIVLFIIEIGLLFLVFTTLFYTIAAIYSVLFL